MNKNVRFAASVLAASLLTGAAQASPYLAVWNGTVSDSSVTGVSAGNTATITMTLDNGGSSAASQTWVQADLQSVAFAFGSTLTTFVKPFGGGVGFSGGWVTGAGGTLIAVPTMLGDISIGTDYTTNLTQTPAAWSLDGTNGIFFASSGAAGVAVNAVATITSAPAWTLSPASPPSTVPEIDAAASTGALTLLLGALGLAAERRRKAA